MAKCYNCKKQLPTPYITLDPDSNFNFCSMECFYESVHTIYNNSGVEAKIYILKAHLDYILPELKSLEKKIDRLERQINLILKSKH